MPPLRDSVNDIDLPGPVDLDDLDGAAASWLELCDQVNRIECRLNQLIVMLAAEAEQEKQEEGPTHDLEGNELPAERPDGELL